MSINSKHPLYNEFANDWQTMRDTYRGQRVVKEKGELYLSPTSGMQADGMGVGQIGYKSYQAYKTRSVFHEFVSMAVEAMVGMMHHKPPTIELPSALEPMRDNATIHGESLEHLLRRINEQQLVTGRLGLLLDLPENPDQANPLPYIATYMAEHMINWDDGVGEELSAKPELNLVVLNETNYQRDNDLQWELKDKYRVLILGDLVANEAAGSYSMGVYNQKGAKIDVPSHTIPSIRGNTLDKIPFVFINSKDIVSNPDDPPLLGLANVSLAIYRGEADYRQNLFMQGQDTLVIIGASDDDSVRVGAGATLRLNIGGDAKYVGVNSQGLAEQRQCLENDKMSASNQAAQLIDTRSAAKESGDALQIRVAAQTATLNQLALSGAAGLQKLLRIAAEWVGANPEEVVVTPNLDFAPEGMNARELVELMTAKTMGAPLSKKSIHETLQDRGYTQLSYEEELKEIEDEELATGGGTDAGGNPDPDPNQGQQ